MIKECDLIMKGGVTSGIVYPSAVYKLAEQYRFVNIGGASAGAIAAVASAAAEYRRQISKDKNDMSGFEALNAVPDKLGNNLINLFRPAPKFRAIFDLLLTFSGGGGLGKKLRGVWGLAPGAHLILALTIILGIICCALNHAWGGFIAFLLFGVIGLALILISKIKKLVLNDFVTNHFGMCTGLREKGAEKAHPALTEWLCDQIDGIAFGDKILKSDKREPLSVGDLKKQGIEVKAMSTDLSAGRPYELPLQTNIFFFLETEFAELFPPYIMKYLKNLDINKDGPNEDGYYRFPSGDLMPVIMIARMSLSFPILISAIPLYRRDFLNFDKKNDKAPWVKCIFSDGGISSNFPIHFFDELLPSRPAFGISLDDFDPQRHKNLDKVNIPERAPNASNMPSKNITSLGSFLKAIVNVSKDWNDTLQSRLPGYAERIVTVRLNPKTEGGLNLNMEDKRIKILKKRGVEAGEKLSALDVDQIRHTQMVSGLPLVEDLIVDFSNSFDRKGEEHYKSWSDIIDIGAENYVQTQTWKETIAKPFAQSLANLGNEALKNRAKGKGVNSGNSPSIDANISLVALADRTPKV